MKTANLSWENNLRKVLAFLFPVLFAFIPVILMAHSSPAQVSNKQQEFTFSRYVKNRRQETVQTEVSSLINAAAPKKGTKGLVEKRQLLNKLTTYISSSLKLAPEIPSVIFERSKVFEIVPCYQYFLRIRSLLI